MHICQVVCTPLVVMVTFKAMLPFALQALIPLKHPLSSSFCRRVETKKKIKKPELTSFLIAFGNKSPVFPNEKGITRTKLRQCPSSTFYTFLSSPKQQFARYYHFAHSFTQLVTLGDTTAVQQSRTGDRTQTLRATMALEIVKFSFLTVVPRLRHETF